MKGSKVKPILFTLLLIASISSLVYLNINKASYNTPVLSQPKLEELNNDQIRLPDVHILETATKILRRILPSG